MASTDMHTRKAVAQALRRQAEENLRQKAIKESNNRSPRSADETQVVLHELRVHQIELDIQNEELRRAQVELDGMRARYFDLYNLAPVGYCTISEQGLVLEANLTAANLLGEERGALVKQPFTRFIWKEDQDIYYLHRKQLFATREPQVCELRMVKSDGSTFWAHLVTTAAQDPPISAGQDEGGALVCRAILSDISGLKAADTEHTRERKYQEIARTILQILNEPGNLLECVERVLTTLKAETGLDAVGIRLQKGEDFPYLVQQGFPEDFLLTENTLLTRSIDGGLCRDKDGRVILECTCGLVLSGKTDPHNPLFTAGGSCWINDTFPLLDIPSRDDPRLHPRNICMHQGYASLALVPIRNKDQIIGLIQLNDRRKGCFTLKSIEQLEGIAAHLGAALSRKQIENDLRESEARYAATMSAVDDGLWEWHVPSGQTIFSAIYYRMLGYQEGEFPASYDAWRELVHPDDLARVETDLRLSLQSGKGFIIDLRMKKKTGEWLWVSARGKAIEKDAEDQGLRLVGTLSDITERKWVEAEKVRLETQLRQAQKMEAIGTLAGGIAHDFNNILGAILGYAEMAREDSPVGSIQRKDIDQVVQASLRAKDLVKQILAFSRQGEIVLVPMQPAPIVREVSKMLRSSLPSTIAIRQKIDTEAGRILADPTQIHQIVMNLCTNAYHAMEETGGTLSISLQRKKLTDEDIVNEPLVQPGNFVRLSVGDTGSGIDAEIQDKIFDPYFTTKEIGKGTGMGLAIIHGIVKSYNGFVSFHSHPGEGTVFQVFLPVMEDVNLGEETPEDHVQLGNERILLIDDEEILTEMGKNMLERLGYHVTARANSIEALTTFQNQPDQFDLVITDQTMPGMTGSDLARRMLRIRPDIPIILCTGYSNIISEEQVKSLGIKGFAMKPLARKNIGALIREVLAGRVVGRG